MRNTEKDVFVSFLKEEIFEQGYEEYYKDKYGNAWEIVKKFWEELCEFQIPEKVEFTIAGEKILSFMKVYCEQRHDNKYEFTVKEISESLLLVSAAVAKSLDKLSRDGYVYKKRGKNQNQRIKYILTNKGLNCVIKELEENKE